MTQVINDSLKEMERQRKGDIQTLVEKNHTLTVENAQPRSDLERL